MAGLLPDSSAQTLMPAARGPWLVRHAQPLIDVDICYGSTDVAAHAGASQASAEVLALELPQATRVLCSPLQRCTQLVEPLARLRPDLHLCIDKRLVEMDFGCWEGWRWDAIPKSALDEWTADFAHWRFGGRESVAELMRRVADVWTETCARDDPVAWITHVGVIRAATLVAGGKREVLRSEDWPTEVVGFGQFVRLPG